MSESFKTKTISDAIRYFESSDKELSGRGSETLLKIKESIIDDTSVAKNLMRAIHSKPAASHVEMTVKNTYKAAQERHELFFEFSSGNNSMSLSRCTIKSNGQIKYSLVLPSISKAISEFGIKEDSEDFGPIYCWALVNMHVFYIAVVYFKYIDELKNSASKRPLKNNLN